jgi:hypothetical protein
VWVPFDNGEIEKQINEDTVRSISITKQGQDVATNYQEASSLFKTLGETMNIEAWAEFQGVLDTIGAQATSAGANELDLSKYLELVDAVTAYQQKVQDGTKLTEEEQKHFRSLIADIGLYSKKITNITSQNQMNESLKNTITIFSEMSEQFSKLTDESAKLELVRATLDNFGIDVNKTNYQYYADLVQSIAAGGEDSYDSFVTLMKASATQYGITLEEIEAVTSDGWTGTLEDMSEEMRQFVTAMDAAGTGMWEAMADGSQNFVLAFSTALQDAIALAGTAQEAAESVFDWLYNSDERLNAT